MIKNQTILAVDTSQHTSLDVLFQKEVCLEIDVPVFHVKYGRDEICQYVNTVAKPELETFTEAKEKELSQAIDRATATAQEHICRYREETIQPEIELYVTNVVKPGVDNYVDCTLKPELQNLVGTMSNEFNENAEKKTAVINEAVSIVENAVVKVTAEAEMVAEKQQQAKESADSATTAAEMAMICERSVQRIANEAKEWAVGTIDECTEGSAKYWAQSVNSDNFVRPGTVIMHPLFSLNGYLLCNGAAVSRTTYANLYSVIGTRFGAGDGSTTFNVPDFRGDFIRGYLSGTTATIGTRQNEGLPNISGAPLVVSVNPSVPSPAGAIGYREKGWGLTGGTQTYAQVGDFKASSSNSIYGNSSHVTPCNNALNFFIKY